MVQFPAPRSRSGHEASSADWTSSFVPGRAISTRWRWVLLTGTLTASVFFQIGNISNADSQERSAETDTANAKVVSNDGNVEEKAVSNAASSNAAANIVAANAETTTATSATTGADLLPNTDNAVNDSANSATTNTLPTAIPTLRTVKLKLTVDGKARTLEVKDGQKLSAALSAEGIVLEKLDRVWPSCDTNVSNGLNVRLETVREKLETRTEKIAPGFQLQLTTKLAPGREQSVSSGKPGTVTITEKVVYVAGKRVRKSEVSRKVTAPAQDKTVALGTDARFLPHRIPYHNRYARAYQAERRLSARGGSPRDRQIQVSGSTSLRPVKCMTMLCTGYSANEGPIGGGPRTATGLAAVRGAIAVDPRVIPLGTKLYVEGYGYGFACDTGGAIKGNHIDLAFNSVREMNRQGSRKMKVWILADAN